MSFFPIQTNSIKIYTPYTIPTSESNFGTHFSHFGIGGFIEVPNLDFRNEIPVGSEINSDGYSSGRRKLGMLVHVYENNKTYQLSPKHSTTSGGVPGTNVTLLEWIGASNAQKIVWLNPLEIREDVDGVSPTDDVVLGSGNPDDAWIDVTGCSLSLLSGLSGNWESTYTTVCSYSADWQSVIVNLNSYLPLSGGVITGDLTVEGTFMTLGTATFLSSVNVAVDDPLFHLAINNPSNIFDIGFVGHYKDPLENHSGLVRDHQTDQWFLFSGLSSIPLTAIDLDFNDSALIIDTLNANLKGNLMQDTAVFGELTAIKLFTDLGNSDQWQSVYTTVCANSSEWDTTYTTVCSNSAKWETAYSTVSATILHKGNSFGEDVIIGSNDPYSLVLETSGSPRVTILSGGDVGIGTSVPSHTLTVIGDISANAIRLRAGTSSDPAIYIGTDINLFRSAANTLATDDNFRPSLAVNTSSTTVIVASSDTSPATLQRRNANTAIWNTTAVFLTSEATASFSTNYIPKATTISSLGNSVLYEALTNIGVGTTTPNEKLTVNGSISASDYVFQRTKINLVASTSYTFNVNDPSCMVLFNVMTPATAYVPEDSNFDFAVGSSINFATLSSLVYVAGELGVTIRAADQRNYLRTTNSAATLLKIAPNDWFLFGDIWSETLN